MKVLITGANGMVGSSVVAKLAALDGSVRAAVRRDGCAFASGVETVMVGSLMADADWRHALHGVDAVVHCAARVHLMKDVSRDPLQAFRQVNTFGSRSLAQQAAEAGVKRFVYLSSIKVNGECTMADQPFSETSEPCPQDPYGISKWEAEQALRQVGAETGMEVVILRPPLVYGPGVAANFLRLLRAVDRGVPFPFRAIDNHRSLIYLGNLVDAIQVSLLHPAAVGKTYLVSDGDDVSTPELIRRLAGALARTPRWLPVPPSWLKAAGRVLGKGQEMERLFGSLTVDARAIRRDLNWTPPFSMQDGLRATAQWYRQRQTSC